MKRILAFLLLIIVAVAAFTPCCTEDDCQDEITAISKFDHGKADNDGGCSPFFACTGCLGFTLVQKAIAVPVPAEYHPQYFAVYFDFISSSYAISPWQPPRAA